MSDKKLIVPIMLGSEFPADLSMIPEELKLFSWYLLSESPSDVELEKLIKYLDGISR